MWTTGAEQVEQAVDECVGLLEAVTDRDWEAVRAGRLEWSCRETAVHIAEDLIAYAGQLAGREQEAYTPFELSLEEGTDNAGALRGDPHDGRPVRRRDPHHAARGPGLPPVSVPQREP
ncbi:hypothetical protein QFZ43_004935 [Streptomyces afghaniensis]|nr:hypothetical protein [Streptomyces afghaniensis]